MFEFIDTPNPNAKKIILNHNFEIAVYLNAEKISDDDVLKIYNHPNIENIFSGPGFLTLTKKPKASWDNIIKDLDT